MKDVLDESDLFVDPHTATALHAAYSRRKRSRVPQVVMATASIHKFEPDVQDMLGADVELPERPEALQGIEAYADRFETVPNDLDAVMTAVDAFRYK